MRRIEDRGRAVLNKLEITRGGTHKEVFTVKCAFLYDIYGIVEYSNYNKGECLVSVSHVLTSIPPKCAKTREPEDEHCVLQCSYK